MDSVLTIERWQTRLRALADKPPYVFRETPVRLIAEHYRRLTTFAGYTEASIAEVEQDCGGRLPSMFRAYMLRMGKCPGDLFCGSDLAGPADFRQFRSDALELMAETPDAQPLPEDSVIFMSHQGYTFCYIRALGGYDGPVWQWTEGSAVSRQISPSFADFVDAEIDLMELNHREWHDRGGYYLTLYPGGAQDALYPSLNSGERPLDDA